MSGSERINCACDTPRAERIARLNDQLRKTGEGGQIVVTSGVRALSGYNPIVLLSLLATQDDFDADSDPHGERDFGALDYLEAELLWKVDYYDPELTYHSDDPSNSEITVRVLTVMLASEY